MKTKKIYTLVTLFMVFISWEISETTCRAQSVDVGEYFHLDAGKKWTYRENNLNTITISVLAGFEYVNGRQTTVVEQIGGESAGLKTNYSITEEGIFEHKEFMPQAFIEGYGFADISIILNPPLKYINRKANIGETITSSGDVTFIISGLGTFSLSYDSTSRIIGLERVTVPLDFFDAVKIQTSLSIHGMIYGEYFSDSETQTIWLAENIGIVKRMSSGEVDVIELESINFVPPPNANFTANPTSGFAPFGVSFSDQSKGDITHWFWSFGDGKTSTERHPTHIYDFPGSYEVSLTVTGQGGSNSLIKTDYITVAHAPPIADFSASPVGGPAPLEVRFTNHSSGTISDMDWYFGDGEKSQATAPIHTYLNPGVYSVILNVSGPGGSDSKTKTNYIIVQRPSPIASFSASISKGLAPLTVQFVDESIGDVDVWNWHFSDGSTSDDSDPVHVFLTPGNYSVSLTVTGPDGSATLDKMNFIHVGDQRADINSDQILDLKDAIIVLQVLTRWNVQLPTSARKDGIGDSKVGLAEAIYVLNFVSK